MTGTVTSVAAQDDNTQASHRTFTDTSRTEADDHFALGEVEWTVGNNCGRKSECKSFKGDQFVLWDTMQFEIQVGDQYKAVAGDDKLYSTCKTKFMNEDRFGGKKDKPLRDGLAETPDAR